MPEEYMYTQSESKTELMRAMRSVADEGKNASVGQYHRSVSNASCSVRVYPLLPSFLRRFWKTRAYFGRQIKLSQDHRWVYFRRRQMPTRSSADFSSEYAICQLRRIWNWTCVMDFIICTTFAVKVWILLYLLSIFHVRRTKFQKSNICKYFGAGILNWVLFLFFSSQHTTGRRSPWDASIYAGFLVGGHSILRSWEAAARLRGPD